MEDIDITFRIKMMIYEMEQRKKERERLAFSFTIPLLLKEKFPGVTNWEVHSNDPHIQKER